MKRLETVISELSEQELREAFDEIIEWRKEGILKRNGIVRRCHEEFNRENSTEYPVHAMESPVLFEIAKRHYHV